jgi:alpha,alpha-trehalase
MRIAVQEPDRVQTPESSAGPREGECAASYILEGWETLTRSMNDCASLTDVKVMTHPVLYLPAGIELPAKVAELENSCYVQVRSLPRMIGHMGDVTPEELPGPGLLYLPNPYVVPGGRFNEMYGWDSYFILLGVLRSGMRDLARGMMENFLFEIEHYGAVLNANRTYYLTRSQPPFLTSMIRSILEDQGSFPDNATALAWLGRAYDLAARYYRIWTQPERLAGSTGLARYYDLGKGPVHELADDSTYFHDVIGWLLEHPDQDPGYLVKSQRESNPDPQHPEHNCDPRTGATREPACVRGYGLSDDFYLGDRAMRESGFDSSFRFGPFCGSTHHYAPVCLNSLLYRYEQEMAEFAAQLGLKTEVEDWNSRAAQRKDAMQKYLWQEEDGLFLDYDFIKDRPSHYDYLSAYYPLWAGLATQTQAQSIKDSLYQFERFGGLTMSSTESGMQWDEPYGWAPANWIVVQGLLRYGFGYDARRIATAFIETIDANFAVDATLREKYDVVRRAADVHVTAGYKENVIGFGWTNGVYLKMREMLAESHE